MSDTRIAYGAFCTWWGPTGMGVPSCPHCRGVLYEEPDLESWYRRLDAVPANRFPDYRKVMQWQRDTKRHCSRSYVRLREAYDAAQAGQPT